MRAGDGKLDLENGKYREVKPTNTRVKYKKEACFALVVSMVRTLGGKVEGRRCNAYNHTSKTVVLYAKWNHKVREEINRVKNLTGSKHGNKGQWSVNIRGGRVSQEDILAPGII